MSAGPEEPRGVPAAVCASGGSWRFPSAGKSLWLGTSKDLYPTCVNSRAHTVFYNPILLSQHSSWCLVLVLFQIKGKICLCHPALPHQHVASQYRQGIFQAPEYYPCVSLPPLFTLFHKYFQWRNISVFQELFMEISLWGLKLQHHSCLFLTFVLNLRCKLLPNCLELGLQSHPCRYKSFPS